MSPDFEKKKDSEMYSAQILFILHSAFKEYSLRMIPKQIFYENIS